MMTNFEKWKNDLAPEKLLYSGFHAGNPYKATVFVCSYCPADRCPRKDPRYMGHEAICEREFLTWAETQREPEGE
jgi:hypothetical protein